MRLEHLGQVSVEVQKQFKDLADGVNQWIFLSNADGATIIER
jgi:hypothetical protein